jgi:thiol-disulfide isomerase/thioredoxin
MRLAPVAAAGVLLTVVAAGCGSRGAETLAIGSPAPRFALPGTDGRTHSLDDYARSAVLAVVFTCNHCPIAQLYEQRIQRLHADYRGRGVAVVAINPDSPKTVSLKDQAYTDVPDTLEGMAVRAAHRKLEYPYLYDGDAQAAAAAFKVVALPQIFVFDAQRRLQYVGRLDDNIRADRGRARDARAAIDALLAQQPVRIATTPVDGCSVAWLGKTTAVETEQAEIKNARVDLQMIAPPALETLRRNGTPNLMLINFWASWCRPCIAEFPDLVATDRMYRQRRLEFVTVSIDVPASRESVMRILQEQRAATRNFMFDSEDTARLQEAFDPALPASVPFTLLLAPNGDVLHQQHGEAEVPSLRRAILANLPEDPKYPGLQAYWAGH